MKRGTPESPKVRRLAKFLGISIPHAVGLLECLWHFTARQAPCGDVGRWPDEEIEEAIGWDGKPGTLIPALVCCRWLDEDQEYRLLIHDWIDHADRGVRMTVKNRGKCLLGAPSD